MEGISASSRSQSVLASYDPCEGGGCQAEPETPRWLCVSCDCTYCDLCWETQGPHRQGKLGQYGLPHEKTDKAVFERLRDIFQPPEEKSELQKLHQDDEETLWFGVEILKDDKEKCTFIDNGRYTSLMAMTKQPTATERYPLLVSFVGQTGSGKSTLIKMLVSLKESSLSQTVDDLFKTPISGSVKDDRSPTSGDVHLYIDPQSAFSDLPMLYADCEGLEGGEVPPTAKTILKMGKQKSEIASTGTPRVLQVPASKGKIGPREFAVRNVYPRLLYTFSDVIVFVLKNTRTFESVALRLLLEWASNSMESSVNQPALPQAVIVLNASDATMDEEEWDGKTATTRLMEHIKYAIHSEPIKKFADQWTKRGKTVNSSEELIKCYYADVRVIRIPAKGRNMLIKKQVDQLHLQLSWACQASFKAKWEARQYCTTEELNRYLQAAFDHFTSKPEQPFNFVDIALKADPIPQSFSDHILALVTWNSDSKNGRAKFKGLSKIVASCILLDCIRYKRPGKPEDLFDQHYALSCSTAHESYHNRYVQCGFTSKKGKQCINSRLFHGKGHQSRSGKLIGYGPFLDPYPIESFQKEWLDTIRSHIIDIEASVREGRDDAGALASREKVAHELHRQNLMSFFGNGSAPIGGHYSCYCCLMELPQHPLPCEHMLCTFCVQMLGRVTDKNTVTVDVCPFDTIASRVLRPCSIRFKPDFAGVRILSLDGGGMRGIVELESLNAIQRVLGKNLPIQAFFDLIVGTSTGGIIALGLGIKEWTVDQCITRFIQLCEKAFTPRELDNVKILRTISLAAFKSRYKSKPLRDALRQTFGEDPLYGRVPEDSLVRDTKVCVTTTSGTVDAGIVVGNYTRQSEDDHWYKFRAGDFMKVWQAAGATSAAPKYFKKFVLADDKGSSNEFWDGALYFNNPIRIAYNERKYLWPDVADNPPDIVLSLGTGQHAKFVDSAVRSQPSPRTPEKSRTLCLPDTKFTKLKNRVGSSTTKKKNILKNVFEALSNRLDSILDAEREFRQFEADHSQPGISDRFVRLNPDLERDPPALDETSHMLPLQEQVQRILMTPSYELSIERIAYRLVASCFYFAKEAGIEHDETTHSYTCRGRIACRFEGNAKDMKVLLRSLGEFFRHQSTPKFKPFFSVRDTSRERESEKVDIGRQTIDGMTDYADFHVADNLKISIPEKLSSTTISLCLQPSRTTEPEHYQISGFPRFLVTEDASTASRLQKRAGLIKSKINKSELIVGDSLFNFLETEQYSPSERKASGTTGAEDELHNLTLVGSPKMKNASQEHLNLPSSSRTSFNKTLRPPERTKSIRPPLQFPSTQHSSQQSDTAITATKHSKHRRFNGSVLRESASISDFRSGAANTMKRRSALTSEDKILVNAMRPPPPHFTKEDVEVIDAMDFVDDDEAEYDDENRTPIPQVGFERTNTASSASSASRRGTHQGEAEDDSDSDGPPSDFEA